jgi:hypothetical protein
VGARWKTFIRQHGGQNAAAIVRRYHGVVIDPGGLTKTADAVLSVCRCDRAKNGGTLRGGTAPNRSRNFMLLRID